MSHPGALNPRLLAALQQATSLELFQLSTVVDQMLADPRRILDIRKRLHLGQQIQFLDWRDGQLRSAKVVALNNRQLVVHETERSHKWTLPYTAILPPEMASQAEPIAQNEPIQPSRDEFRAGDRVSFEDRYLQTQVGVIVRVNKKTASIDTGSGGSWRVSFALLRKVVDV